MDRIKTLLIANRGEIAVRIIKTAKSLGIRTISIYTPADAASLHVSQADEAVLLNGDNSRAYIDGDQIINIAKDKKADAIIPGYGFLSESSDFARAVGDAGIAWCGPSTSAIEAFGIKHKARELAKEAGVPIVPGTIGLVDSAESAVKESEKIGYPVMLKATGGGGGMGLVTCQNADEVKEGFSRVKSRGQELFKNSGLFIERYYPASRHIEVQVFGNAQGQAIHFGERECSIQRRHQKVIEECPSPFVEKHPGLREKLCSAAVALAESIRYGSAGTVEYLVDDKTGDFFFLEMNTRLQVEHGITELCYGVDLVELMLRQGAAEKAGNGGIDEHTLKSMQPSSPKGAAIEARVYAENPLRDYAPSPGLLQKVEWGHAEEGARIDTFSFTGSTITPYYDPLIAKVMYHSSSRDNAIDGLSRLLSQSQICGPPTNLEFLAAIMEDSRFKSGDTLTSFLENFHFNPAVIDVISGGAYTLIQDLPGRPTVGMGICHSGAMDPIALSIANSLVGNPAGKEGLEITLSGPELRFLGPAVVALTGATVEASLDGDEFPMWSRKHIRSGQKLKIGKMTAGGCRSYLAIYGGLPSIADYFGSRSTSPVVLIGGYQGRALAPGDVLSITKEQPKALAGHPSIAERFRPKYPKEWDIVCMPGPHDDGYFTAAEIRKFYETDWQVSHNASRSAIRLVGPVPEWARDDGAEGGAHPSNVVEYGYPLYGLNWTGDEPAILVPDGPNFGGFVCNNTIISADIWKVGQIKAGNTVRYQRVSYKGALSLRKTTDEYLAALRVGIESNDFGKVKPLEGVLDETDFDSSVIHDRAAKGHIPRIRYRQGGDQHLIVCYADDTDHFDINNRVRVTSLEQALKSESAPDWLRNGLLNTVGCCNNLTVYYDSMKIDRDELLKYLISLEDEFGDLSTSKVPCRRIKLPLSFNSKEQDEANKRYQETARPFAPYLPSNFEFVAKNNAFAPDQLKQCYLDGDFITVFVGFYCGLPDAIPVDPRNRFFAPKYNPSRVFTPEGTVGLGGGAIAIYPVDSPGGYQMNGRTIPCWDYYGWKGGFSPESPWLFKDFDLIRFYEVTEEELNEQLLAFRAGKYKFEWEETEMDMAEHNKLLRDTAEEVKKLRERQKTAQDEQVEVDRKTLEQCRSERAKNEVDQGTIEKLMQDSAIVAVEAPVDANVWKVQVEEGDGVQKNQVLTILEAMKLEINVNAPEDLSSAKVEKLLISPGDSIKAGQKLVLLRKES